MKIIIAGDGDTGTHLARQLSYEDQDVVLLGTDAARLADMDARYNILTQEGEATSASAMKAAGWRAPTFRGRNSLGQHQSCVGPACQVAGRGKDRGAHRQPGVHFR